MRYSFRKVVASRTDTVAILFIAAFSALALRLAYVQWIGADTYAAMAEDIRYGKIPLPAQRGLILDRRGRILASNVKTCSIYVQPKYVNDLGKVIHVLSQATGKDERVCGRLLEGHSRYFCPVKNISRLTQSSVRRMIRDFKLKGIGIEERTKRTYPQGETAAHIVGFTNVDGVGQEGLERSAELVLSGTPGYVCAELDDQRRIIPQTRGDCLDPIDGRDIVLTIDAYIQQIAEEALAKSCKTYRASGGSAVVMNPHTGEILALANYPMFNPADRTNLSVDHCRNRAVADMYEPGSTLKVMTAAAAIEERVLPLNRTFRCPGYLQIGKRKIRCPAHGKFQHGHGIVDLGKIIQHSCNVGAAQVGMLLGKQRLHEYEQKFGFGEKPGSGLSGEIRGWLSPPNTWADIQLANVSFGQGIGVTPLQMAAAYCVIANGGIYRRPWIVKEVRTKDGQRVASSLTPRRDKGRRVISARTAATVAKMMTAVVDDGTGKSAKIEGLEIAGKTGSAQQAPYSSNKFVGSFGGFLPADDPKLVIFVMVREPKGSHYGNVVAAPVFREIARRLIWYMRVPRAVPDMFRSARTADAAGYGRSPSESGQGWPPGSAEVRREEPTGRAPLSVSPSAPT